MVLVDEELERLDVARRSHHRFVEPLRGVVVVVLDATAHREQVAVRDVLDRRLRVPQLAERRLRRDARRRVGVAVEVPQAVAARRLLLLGDARARGVGLREAVRRRQALRHADRRLVLARLRPREVGVDMRRHRLVERDRAVLGEAQRRDRREQLRRRTHRDARLRRELRARRVVVGAGDDRDVHARVVDGERHRRIPERAVLGDDRLELGLERREVARRRREDGEESDGVHLWARTAEKAGRGVSPPRGLSGRCERFEAERANATASRPCARSSSARHCEPVSMFFLLALTAERFRLEDDEPLKPLRRL